VKLVFGGINVEQRTGPSRNRVIDPQQAARLSSGSTRLQGCCGGAVGPGRAAASHAAGLPAQAVPAGSVSPFIRSDSASSREPSSIAELGLFRACCLKGFAYAVLNIRGRPPDPSFGTCLTRFSISMIPFHISRFVALKQFIH
jgi:hypothetical protein